MTKSMPEEISNVCIRWQTESPFFAEFLLRFIYVKDETCPTAGIGFDKRKSKMMFVYNKKFLEGLTKVECEGLALHEIMHVLHKYNIRLGSREEKIFNIAQDAVINEIVKETTIGSRSLDIPKGGVFMADIEEMGYTGERITEPIYEFLYDNSEQIVMNSSGATGSSGDGECPSCGGSGKDKNGDECETCEGTGNVKGKKVLSTTDDHSLQSKVPSEMEQAIIEDIVNNAKTRSWGSVSGNTQDEIKSLIATRKIPWQKKIAAYMSKFVNEPGNIYENTWTRRNRRGLPLPGIRKKSKKILLTVDTSGSISKENLEMFFSQVEKIIKNYSSVTLIQWDTKVQKVSAYKKGGWKSIEISGRGGTDLSELYEYIKGHCSWASVVVNFTDGCFSWDFDSYNIPTIWAIVDNDNFSPPFGRTVLVEKDSTR